MKTLIVDFSWLYNKYYYAASISTNNETEAHVKHAQMLYNSFKYIAEKDSEIKKIYIVADGEITNHPFKQLLPEYKNNRSSKKEVYKYIKEMLYLISSVSEKIIVLRNAQKEADEIIASLVINR